MARNGAGVYSLPAGSTATTGTTILASQHNTPLADLESDANTARPVVAGGTGATTAAAARTNLGIGTASFLATASSAQAITADTWARVTFDTEQFDNGSNFASNVFTAPETGLYLFGAAVVINITGSVPDEARIGLSVNGATPSNYYRRLTAADAIDNLSTTAHVTSIMMLTAADTVEIQAFYKTNGASTGGTNSSNFWGVRLS